GERNRVDRGSAFDDAHIVGSLGFFRYFDFRERRHEVGEGIGRIHGAEGAIAVTARAFEGHAIAQRTRTAGGHASGGAAFDREETADVVLVFAFGEQIPHPAQVARTFFT